MLFLIIVNMIDALTSEEMVRVLVNLMNLNTYQPSKRKTIAMMFLVVISVVLQDYYYKVLEYVEFLQVSNSKVKQQARKLDWVMDSDNDTIASSLMEISISKENYLHCHRSIATAVVIRTTMQNH